MTMEESVDKGLILVMDDDEMVRFVAGQTLQKYGYRVGFANDGQEAVEMYRNAMSGTGPYLAVILDLNIPGGMGGKEALDRIREIDPMVKAFVSSGNSNDPVMVDYKKFGFSGIIEKPHFYLDKNLMKEFELFIARPA